MTLTQLNTPLLDMGGMPVLWDSDLGTLVQDPTQGGTNAYGAGDLFHDPGNGDVYQLGSGGDLALVHSGAPPLVPAATVRQGAAPPVPIGASSTNVSSALPAFSSPNTTSAISLGGNPSQFGHQVVSWLSKASFIGGLPNGLLVMAGVIGYQFFSMHKRTRRNPGPLRLRNPGRAKRDRRAAERAGYRESAWGDSEYVRAIRAVRAGGLGERVGRLEQTYALGRRLAGLQRRGVRETKIGRVAYRLNPVMSKTPGGYIFVRRSDGTGGRSFPSGKAGKAAAQTYYRELDRSRD